MKPEHAAHLQNITDIDAEWGGDGSDDDLCKRDDCFELGAGVVACWLFKGTDARCLVCDHLPGCHPENGEQLQEQYLRDVEDESPALGAALREAFTGQPGAS